MHVVRSHTRSVHGEDGVFSHADARVVVMGVVDGHGGREAMQLCCERAIPTLLSLVSDENPPLDALPRLFQSLHAEARTHAGTSGCCLAVVVYDRASRAFVVANAGDVEGIVLTPTSHWSVTTSHRLQHNASEHARVAAHVSRSVDPATGRAVGPPRLYPGGLSCSRGVGDRDAPHLLCEPDVFTGVLGEGETLLFATDGFWDAVTKTTARHLVVKSYDPCRVLGRLRDTTDDATVALLTDRPARARSRLDLLFFPRSPTTSTTSEATSDDDSAASPPRSAPDAEEAGCVVRARTRAPTAPSDA